MNPETREMLLNASRPVRYAAAVALSVLAIFLLVAAIDGLHNWGHPDTAPTNTITVTGEGTATAIPDTATVSFTASATAADVATAEKNMNTIANNALASVKSAGVSSDDITTTSYNVSPHYVNPVCGPGILCPRPTSQTSGYDVSESIQVKIHDTTKVPAVLDGLAKANVQNVSGPDFVVADQQSVMQQARAAAIKKAEADAKILASQLGVHLGRVVSFSDNSGSVPQPFLKAAGATADSASTAPTIPTGQNEYNDTVSITYEI